MFILINTYINMLMYIPTHTKYILRLFSIAYTYLSSLKNKGVPKKVILKKLF